MSQNDPTTKLPDEAKYDTKPGITDVLERINQLGEQLKKRIDEMQAEMRAGFRRTDQKLDLLHKSIFEMQTDHKLLEQRVEQLEEKAS